MLLQSRVMQLPMNFLCSLSALGGVLSWVEGDGVVDDVPMVQVLRVQARLLEPMDRVQVQGG
jgi:hypothetical protein